MIDPPIGITDEDAYELHHWLSYMTVEVSAAVPGDDVSTAPFTLEDIVAVTMHQDSGSWDRSGIIVAELRDGRWVSLEPWEDMTFDWSYYEGDQRTGSGSVAGSFEQIWAYGLDEVSREKLSGSV